MKKAAIILAGCGVYDGAEIHEATATMLALAKAGISYYIFAPDKPQAHVVNHLTGEEMDETRNVLVEAARIARGNISPLSGIKVKDFDALILPGGFGAAKNLSTFAFEGEQMSVDKEVENVIRAFFKEGKVIAALCIAPVILAKVLKHVELTIGEDPGTAAAIESFGASHTKTSFTDVVVDKKNKIVTGPCYMLDSTIDKVFVNAENVVKAMLELS